MTVASNIIIQSSGSIGGRPIGGTLPFFGKNYLGVYRGHFKFDRLPDVFFISDENVLSL